MLIRPCKLALLFAALVLAPIHTASTQTRTRDSSANYSQAENLVRSHEWDQGLALLQPVLKHTPRDLKALNLAGIAYTGKGELKQADEYFCKALALDPAFVPSLKNFGINEFGLHDLASAERHLQSAVRLQPADPVISLYLGEIAYAQQDFKNTAERLQRAESFLSLDPNLKAHLAIAQLQTGQKAAGLISVEELQPEPLAPSSQFALGVALMHADVPDRAIPYFQMLRQRHPESYDTAFNLVICYLDAKRYGDAISLGNQWTAEHDTDELENALAEAYEQTQDTPRAVAALRRAIELNPENDDNYLDFANLCIDHRDFDNGLKVIGVGLQARPK